MTPDTLIADLGVIDYQEAYELQHRISDAKTVAEEGRRLKADVILVLEHFPVFTLGKRGGAQNLMKDAGFLEERGIPLVQTRRGGDITYHGPGQIIIYPILDLARAEIGVADFVERLETVMIKTCDAWGINAVRNPKNHGIWVGNNKVGSIGLAIKHGVCHHGVGFNVTTDLTPFSWINPCGLAGVGMTSVARELDVLGKSEPPDLLETSKQQMVDFIRESLNWDSLRREFTAVNRQQLEERLSTAEKKPLKENII